MRKLILAAASVLLLTIAAPAQAGTRDVRIVKAGFSPGTVTITAGDTVVWVNRDTVNHQVVSDRGAFVSPILGPGKSFSFKFNAAGTYRYRDALEPAERATITVRGAPATVSLGASAPLVVYGVDLHLSGLVSNKKAGEQVTIWAQPYGQASFAQLAVVTTGAGGAWDYVVKPDMQTTYQAKSRSAASQPVTVQVRPKITLLPSRNGRYLYTKVYGAHSFAGQYAYLQRRTMFGEWVIVQRFALGPQSGKLFRVPKRHGVTTYRVWLPATSAGPGYTESSSGTQTARIK
jgi:plastocyanin